MSARTADLCTDCGASMAAGDHLTASHCPRVRPKAAPLCACHKKAMSYIYGRWVCLEPKATANQAAQPNG